MKLTVGVDVGGDWRRFEWNPAPERFGATADEFVTQWKQSAKLGDLCSWFYDVGHRIPRGQTHACSAYGEIKRSREFANDQLGYLQVFHRENLFLRVPLEDGCDDAITHAGYSADDGAFLPDQAGAPPSIPHVDAVLGAMVDIENDPDDIELAAKDAAAEQARASCHDSDEDKDDDEEDNNGEQVPQDDIA